MLSTGDLIELNVDMPEHNLMAGTQGIILAINEGDVYEVDLEDNEGLTVTVTLNRVQFDVIMSFST